VTIRRENGRLRAFLKSGSQADAGRPVTAGRDRGVGQAFPGVVVVVLRGGSGADDLGQPGAAGDPGARLHRRPDAVLVVQRAEPEGVEVKGTESGKSRWFPVMGHASIATTTCTCTTWGPRRTGPVWPV